jgi:hypothetical protein
MLRLSFPCLHALLIKYDPAIVLVWVLCAVPDVHPPCCCVTVPFFLYSADGADLTYVQSNTASAASLTISGPKIDYSPNKSTPRLNTLAVASASSFASLESVTAGAPSTVADDADGRDDGEGRRVAGPNSLCPVVAFASFAAQLSFKMVLHLAVFGGGCSGWCTLSGCIAGCVAHCQLSCWCW